MSSPLDDDVVRRFMRAGPAAGDRPGRAPPLNDEEIATLVRHLAARHGSRPVRELVPDEDEETHESYAPAFDDLVWQRDPEPAAPPSLDPVVMPPPPPMPPSYVPEFATLAKLIGAIGVMGILALVVLNALHDQAPEGPAVAVTARGRVATPVREDTPVLVSPAARPPSPAQMRSLNAFNAMGQVAPAAGLRREAGPPPRDFPPQISPQLREAPQSTAALADLPVYASAVRPGDNVGAQLNQAQALIVSGEVASARQLLLRFADAGHADASYMLAMTYDPGVLSKLRAEGVQADIAMASALYARAAEQSRGDTRARAQLSSGR